MVGMTQVNRIHLELPYLCFEGESKGHAKNLSFLPFLLIFDQLRWRGIL